MAQEQPAPVVFDVEYPESLSRLHLLLKTFLGWLYAGIPHGIILYVYGIIVSLVSLVAFVVILIKGNYPRSLFDIVVGYYRWEARLNAYMGFMTDKYPPFSPDEVPDNPVRLHVEYPERLSKGHALLKFFLGWIYAGIPHGLILLLYALLLWLLGIVVWFAILFTGRYPRGIFNLAVGYTRWSTRVSAYMGLMRDEYPPFNGRP